MLIFIQFMPYDDIFARDDDDGNGNNTSGKLQAYLHT